MVPKVIKGSCHEDSRGTLCYNNDFDAAAVKRAYVIENKSIEIIRAWRGHQIEERWFSAISGAFKIDLIAIDNWENPSKKLDRFSFFLYPNTLDVLHIPPGYVSCIQSLEEGSKLLVMANYMMGELEDEFRFAEDYFE